MSINLQANRRPRIKYNYATHLVRTLRGAGKFKVILGQEVAPDEVLGAYAAAAGFSSIDLARRLKISSNDGLQYLQKPIGSTIFKGELLALKKSVFGNNVVVSPTDGLIENYDTHTGVLRIKFFPKEVTLTSGVYGIIDQIDTRTGEVTIKTLVHEISAVLGAGKQRMGLIKVIKSASNLAKADQVTPDMSQHIVVTGALLDYNAIVKAVQFGVYGLISGGVNYRGFKPLTNNFEATNNIITDVGITVVATEGFGAIPMAGDVYNLLLKYHDQFVYIVGNPPRILLPCATKENISALRTVVLPLNQSAQTPNDLDIVDLQIGATVRIIWPPYMGSIGKIIAIDQTASKLQSGVMTYLLTIEMNSRKIKVPYPNVEVV